MIAEKRAKVAKVFAVLLTIAFILLVILMFFSTGLDVSEAVPVKEGLAVTLQNNSIHLIHDINVSYLDAEKQKVLIAFIASLKPQETKELILLQEYVVEDTVSLVVEAPFHQTLLKHISFAPGAFIRLKPRIRAPKNLFVGRASAIVFELCNEGLALDEVTITPKFEASFLSVDKTLEKFALAKGACISQEFAFTGLKPGSTTIYFNVNALSFTEDYPILVEIFE